MLGKYKGRYALLSKKTGKPLAYAPGTEKPSDEWVAKQEARVEYFKNMGEDGVDMGVLKGPVGEEYGAGFEGTKQLVHNYVKATPGAVKTIKRIVRDKYKRS